MLSVTALSSGQLGYYTGGSTNFIEEGGEAPGLWLGSGAGLLGLHGQVTDEDLAKLFDGFLPDGTKLVQNAGKKDRVPGWSLTFSPPKSVSVLWSQARDARTKRVIEQAHREAIRVVLQHLEKTLVVSRTGQAGSGTTSAKLIAAAFEHDTSRELDPLLHTHLLIMNAAVNPDGKTRTIVPRPFYQSKMLLGALYRCQLAKGLMLGLGLSLYRNVDRYGRPLSTFEIEGIPQRILDFFSKRAEQIKQGLADLGMFGAKVKSLLALTTRNPEKNVPPRTELYPRWQAEGQQLGYREPAIRQLLPPTQEELRTRYVEALDQAVSQITFSKNYFSATELTRRVLESAQTMGLNALAVCKNVERDLVRDDRFIETGTKRGERIWTTLEVVRLEKKALESVYALQARRFRGVSDLKLRPILERSYGGSKTILGRSIDVATGTSGAFKLDSEQKQAVTYLAKGLESVKLLTGWAGTSKTTVLQATKLALEAEGYTVIGTALSGRAAKSLETKTGIPSDTIRMRQLQLYPGLIHRATHHLKQVIRALKGKRTFKRESLRINSRTVLIVDEAGVVGTRDFEMLLTAVKERGGAIIFVGDQWQLPAIERGGMLRSLARRIGGAHLSTIRRQKSMGDRDAVQNALVGRPEEVLRHYMAKNQFHILRTAADAAEQVIRDWDRQGGTKDPRNHKLTAQTIDDVAKLNLMAQARRVLRGEVKVNRSLTHQDGRYFVGDRVRFKQPDRKLGIQTGMAGTIVGVKQNLSGKYLQIRIDSDTESIGDVLTSAIKHHAVQFAKAALGRKTKRWNEPIEIRLTSWDPLARRKGTIYDSVQLDYCITTASIQGSDYPNAYSFLSGPMSSRELAYVQTSRHSDRLQLYADYEVCGLSELAAQHPEADVAQYFDSVYSPLLSQMRESQADELAHDVVHGLEDPSDSIPDVAPTQALDPSTEQQVVPPKNEPPNNESPAPVPALTNEEPNVEEPPLEIYETFIDADEAKVPEFDVDEQAEYEAKIDPPLEVPHPDSYEPVAAESQAGGEADEFHPTTSRPRTDDDKELETRVREFFDLPEEDHGTSGSTPEVLHPEVNLAEAEIPRAHKPLWSPIPDTEIVGERDDGITIIRYTRQALQEMGRNARASLEAQPWNKNWFGWSENRIIDKPTRLIQSDRAYVLLPPTKAELGLTDSQYEKLMWTPGMPAPAHEPSPAELVGGELKRSLNRLIRSETSMEIDNPAQLKEREVEPVNEEQKQLFSDLFDRQMHDFDEIQSRTHSRSVPGQETPGEPSVEPAPNLATTVREYNVEAYDQMFQKSLDSIDRMMERDHEVEQQADDGPQNEREPTRDERDHEQER